MDIDEIFMAQAIALAREGVGRTLPNPSVGCVIVGRGTIVGAARTADGGRPHAETQALAQAGEKARGATAYVTLEPCNTHGKTGPCAQALIRGGIARVVVACLDPSQQEKNAQGIEAFKHAGVQVTLGIGAVEASTLYNISVPCPPIKETSFYAET